MPNYHSWMKGFMDAWKNLDGEGAMKFIAKNCRYYEAPDENPCEDWEAVRKLWIVVPDNQKDISYSYKILCSNDDVAIFNWNMTRTMISGGTEVRQKIDGIFQVSLDSNDCCTYFKQWRHTVTI